MPNTYGSMMLVSNGRSYMSFDMGVDTYEINAGKIAKREQIGKWSAGAPGNMMWMNGGEEKINQFRAKNVYRVVSVLQPPFLLFNETTSKYGMTRQNVPLVEYVKEEDVEIYIMFKRMAMSIHNKTKEFNK